MRADPATSGLDVVVVTADGYAEGDESLRSLGVREHLTKPIDVGRLLELVDAVAPSPPRPGNGGHAFRDREIVEAVPHGIALLDLDGLVLDVNPATEQLLGLRRDELIGRSCLPFTHPEDHETELPFLSAVLRGESDGYTLEKRYVRSDGETVWARLDLRVILDEVGAPLRLLATIEDVRERRRHDEEQRRLSEQIATILECVTDGFVALDRDWRYTYVNERAGELLGRKPADLIGKNIWEEFPDGVDQPFHDAYQRAMAEQTTVFLEEHYEPWDRWFENRIYGSRTGVAIYFTEVTERKRIEETERRQRERADALREVNDALTSTLDLHEMLGVLLDSLRGFVPYTTAGVLLLADDEPLVVGALRGEAVADDDVRAAARRAGREPARAAGAGRRAGGPDRGQRPRAGRSGTLRPGAGSKLVRRSAARRRRGDRPLRRRELGGRGVRSGGRRLGRGAHRACHSRRRERTPPRSVAATCRRARAPARGARRGSAGRPRRQLRMGQGDQPSHLERRALPDLRPRSGLVHGEVRDLRRAYPSGRSRERSRRRFRARSPSDGRSACRCASCGRAARFAISRRGARSWTTTGSVPRGCSASATT